jgi:hypothetical protein
MTEKRNQREILWFHTGGALNFITTVPHCGDSIEMPQIKTHNKNIFEHVCELPTIPYCTLLVFYSKTNMQAKEKYMNADYTSLRNTCMKLEKKNSLNTKK